MSDNNSIDKEMSSLLENMHQFISLNSVVGEVIKVGDTTIIPLVDVSFGLGSGMIVDQGKTKGSAGLGAKLSPNAVLVISKGKTKLVNIKNQDLFTKITELVPDITGKIFKNKKKSKDVDEAIDHAFDNIK